MGELLFTRKVGRTVLAVYAAERGGTGLGGRTLARATGYNVCAMANSGRMSSLLAVCETLDTATEYVNCYRMSFGLITKGQGMMWDENGNMAPSEADILALVAEVTDYLEAGDFDTEDRWNF